MLRNPQQRARGARAATADGATVAGPLRLLPEAKMDNIPNGKDLIAKGEKFIGCKEEFLPCKFPGRVVGQVADFLPASYVTFFHIPTDRIDTRQANHCESLIKCTDNANSSR